MPWPPKNRFKKRTSLKKVVWTHFGLYYGSYGHPRPNVWLIGVMMLFLMIVTAFLGYVLPWGQMSFWGATVMTSLASAMPMVGQPIVQWLWGGFSVDNATLNRFFSLHYLGPFVIVGSSIVHMAWLHQYGSNNPLGVYSGVDRIAFGNYYAWKDEQMVDCFMLTFSTLVFTHPKALGHHDNA